MTKEEREKWVRQLCKDKNYDAATTERVVAKAHRDAESEDGAYLDAILELPVKGTADYNRMVDELKNKAKTLDQWHAGAVKKVSDMETQLNDANAKLRKIEAKYGDISKIVDLGDGTGRTEGGDVVNIDKVRNEIKAANHERNVAVMQIIADQNALQAEHFARTGKFLDVTPLLVKVGEIQSDDTLPEKQRNVTLRDVYLMQYGEEVKQHEIQQKQKYEADLKAEGAKEERARLQKAGLKPTGAAIGESSTLFHAISTTDKKDDPDRSRSEEDSIALFAQEIAQEMAKVEGANT